MKSIQRFICFLLFFGLYHSPFAQEVAEFGQFTAAEIAMKECSFDKDAEAVILFDRATSNYNDQNNLVTTRNIRLKVLKEKGISRGNISIHFNSKNDFEFIIRIKGIVGSYDENGNFVYTKLEKKSIYRRKINENISEVTFAMPNVKVGSIIEYEYVSRMEHYGGLDDW